MRNIAIHVELDDRHYTVRAADGADPEKFFESLVKSGTVLADSIDFYLFDQKREKMEATR